MIIPVWTISSSLLTCFPIQPRSGGVSEAFSKGLFGVTKGMLECYSMQVWVFTGLVVLGGAG